MPSIPSNVAFRPEVTWPNPTSDVPNTADNTQDQAALMIVANVIPEEFDRDRCTNFVCDLSTRFVQDGLLCSTKSVIFESASKDLQNASASLDLL